MKGNEDFLVSGGSETLTPVSIWLVPSAGGMLPRPRLSVNTNYGLGECISEMCKYKRQEIKVISY